MKDILLHSALPHCIKTQCGRAYFTEVREVSSMHL